MIRLSVCRLVAIVGFLPNLAAYAFAGFMFNDTEWFEHFIRIFLSFWRGGRNA